MEARVKESLSRAESLEAELAAQQAASKERQEALEAEKAGLEEQLGQVLSRQQQLALALQAAQAAGRGACQKHFVAIQIAVLSLAFTYFWQGIALCCSHGDRGSSCDDATSGGPVWRTPAARSYWFTACLSTRDRPDGSWADCAWFAVITWAAAVRACV